MRRVLLSLFLCGAFFTCSLLSQAHANTGAVQRGRYLVEQVSKCGDCHTPHVAGVPDKTRWLKGSVLGFQPLHPVPGWAAAAPDLTHTSPLWKSWGDSALVRFFVTGRAADGKPPVPPMPSYTLTPKDARDLVAYLKSLP